MPQDTEQNKPGQGLRDESLLANVALLYYKEGLNQGEIAKRLGVSRATIINYLREGRDRGIVDIRVQGESFSVSSDTRRLCEIYGLEDAYVAYAGPDADPELALRQTARVGSAAIHNILEAGDRIGVAWGETMGLLAEDLPQREIPGSQICQIIGSMPTDRLPAAETCAIQIAGRIGAECFTLHAPAVLSSADLAKALREEPTIHKQLSRLADLDAVLFSVGDLSDSAHLVASGIVSQEDLHWANEQGAAGFICGRFISEGGKQMALPIEDRMIAMYLEDILRAPKRILIAAGLKKLPAVRAAIIGGFVTHAILDEALAQALISGPA